jgi:uncharacterized delta-60 repeat protein
MTIPGCIARILALACLSGLMACGGGGDDGDPAPAPPPPPPAGTVIGAAGGTVTGPSGASVVIPAGALTAETRISIEVSSAGAPALPGSVTASGQMFAFTPHGTTFAVPVTITLPFAGGVPAGQTPAFYKTINNQTQWDQVIGATFGANTMTAQVTSFSLGQIVIEPLFRGDPVREWTFSDFTSPRMSLTEISSGRQEGGAIERFQTFGPVFGTSPEYDHEVTRLDGSTAVPDGIADGYVFSTADGRTYGAFAEAPYGQRNDPESPLGGQTLLRQRQAFIKRSSSASLSFTLTGAFIDVHDEGEGFTRGPQINPPCTYPPSQVDDIDACQDLVRGQIKFFVKAFTHATSPTTPGTTFFSAAALAEAQGHRNHWFFGTEPTSESRIPMWAIDDFDIDFLPENTGVIASFRGPRTFHIDLSALPIGQEFTLKSTVLVEATNRQGDNNVGTREAPSGAAAFLRDPIAIDGVSLQFAGLEPVPAPELVEPPDTPVEPAACTPGPPPDPLAGLIEFDSADYETGEIVSGATPIRVRRTGGTRGAVTATLRTADVSAVAGADYDALATSVFFADGDAQSRVVRVTVSSDGLFDEGDETLSLTLSQPGGCAALGPQSTATLTIRDEDRPPPPPGFTVGGTVSGLVGSGLVLRDHRFEDITPGNGAFTFSFPTQLGSSYEVTIRTQPSNPIQVCTIENGSGTMGNANVTNIAVTCAPPSVPGGLDPGFGGGTGKVTSTVGGDETDMLLQADGKIVMIGGSATDFVMARFNPDGTPDSSFGTAGVVTTDIAGGLDAAFGGTLLADGRIVVVGSARVGSNDDFAVVRYLPNGTPDPSFGTQGRTTTDFSAGRDRAFAVAAFPDDSIVVVGDAILATGADFGLARYTANGVLDATFGGGGAGAGKVNTDIAGGVDIAKNVIIESGGTILVTGTITMGSPVLGHAGLARYSATGVLDASLGTNGTLSIPGISLGDGLALQADGRILVAGNAIVNFDTHFAVMRLLTSGAADPSFGSGGLATAGFTVNDDYGRDVTLDGAGRILVSGQSSNLVNSAADFAVARFTTAGVLDATFDDDGLFTVDFFGGGDSAENVAVQPDGRIVLGGFAANGTAVRYGLARINP